MTVFGFQSETYEKRTRLEPKQTLSVTDTRVTKNVSRDAFDKEEGGGTGNSSEDWICSTCSQLDTPCMSDMVICDGPCQRSFHVVCLDVDETELSEEKWYCEDCQREEHA